ncbi:dihydrodipicolinate reductase [Zoogloea sp.]|uniref:dihydrodipicolinate reductase n=1 Tax=Zoogloea sp. TaxID=49181 RepID=UPI001416B975|nr:MAG: dihydrodipicolinate reductase [Zoogloea sp.]
MQVFIAGTGKLATELLDALTPNGGYALAPWPGEAAAEARAIVVHAGSGRELDGISRFCQRTRSVLVELATGSSLEAAGAQAGFPIVLCPNTNILMLKFMGMLERSGALFKGSQIRITESHQASKTSVPGTAVAMAHALGVAAAEILSVRDSARQEQDLGIPPAHLGRHAFHRIEIQDGPCAISMETRVYGDSPYASGVDQIIRAIQQRELEKRLYSINEFIENGWV